MTTSLPLAVIGRCLKERERERERMSAKNEEEKRRKKQYHLNLSTLLSLHLSIHLPIHLPINLSVYLPPPAAIPCPSDSTVNSSAKDPLSFGVTCIGLGVTSLGNNTPKTQAMTTRRRSSDLPRRCVGNRHPVIIFRNCRPVPYPLQTQ